MRVTLTLLSLLLLPVVVGCEGNTPRRSPLAVSSSPTAAKKVEYAPPTKGATPAQPAGQANPGNPAAAPGGNPAAPGEANPAAGAPPMIGADKINDRREDLMYHTAIFLRKEVGALAGTGINENNNFVFRPAEGLNKLQIGPLVYGHKAEFGKPPQTAKDLVKLVGDFLPQLKPNEFYVYDPELVTEPNKEEMLYLQQYP
jgi:hypothetical protein